MTITLRESLMTMVTDAAGKAGRTTDAYVASILDKHFAAELEAQMPSVKEIILGNLKNIATGTTFTVIDVMDSMHKRSPKRRGDYGRMLSLLIARNQIPVAFTEVMKDTYKVYIKR